MRGQAHAAVFGKMCLVGLGKTDEPAFGPARRTAKGVDTGVPEMPEQVQGAGKVEPAPLFPGQKNLEVPGQNALQLGQTQVGEAAPGQLTDLVKIVQSVEGNGQNASRVQVSFPTRWM